MGGLLIIAAASIAFLPLSRLHAAGADDLRHDARLRRDRLPRRLHQAAPPALARALGSLEDAAAARRSPSPSASPRTTSSSATTSSSRSSTRGCRSGPFWYVLLFLIIAGAVNGVNLTDGLDGLAAGTGIIALATFTAMAVTIFIRSGDGRRTGASRTGSTSPSSARRCRRPRSASSGSTRSRPRCSWATPARWRSAARSRRWRS